MSNEKLPISNKISDKPADMVEFDLFSEFITGLNKILTDPTLQPNEAEKEAHLVPKEIREADILRKHFNRYTSNNSTPAPTESKE